MKRILFAGGLAAALLLAGCDQLLTKATKDDLAAGDKNVAAGDFRGAIADYEAALDGTEKSAKAHWKLALLYDDKLKNPRDAIHHLERYLGVAPAGSHAKDAKAMLKQAETRLAIAQGKGSFITQEEAVRLKNDNLELIKKLTAERAKKAATPYPASASGSAAGKKGDAAQRPIPPGTRTHVVLPGETMASIAQKYYKNKGRWKDIQDANFYSTGGTPTIKPGQTLIVP